MSEVIVRHTPACPFRIKKKANGENTKHTCASCGKQRFHPNHHSPSLNQFGKNRSGFLYNNAKQAWQAHWLELLAVTGLPTGLSKVYVEGRMSFGNAVERDQGNHRYFLEKALGDALQKGGYIRKDIWGMFEFGQLARTDVAGERWTELVIFPTA